MSHFKLNVNPSKRGGMAGLLLGISLWLRPLEIPQTSPASPRKTPSIPPLLLGLTQYGHSVDLKDGLLNNRVCTVKFPVEESYFLCNTAHTELHCLKALCKD